MPDRSILFLNAGYCAGLHGSRREYVFRGYRQLFPNQKIQRKSEQQIIRLLRSLRPDVCCLTEMTHDSFERIRTGLARIFPSGDVANKYSPRFPRRSRFMKSRVNGILLREPRPVRKHYFSRGRKRLLFEVPLRGGIRLFTAHFSLTAALRRKQFNELAHLVRPHRRVILCGDFNIFRGLRELTTLRRMTRLHLVNGGEDRTYPACKPQKSFDLFLCSPGIVVRSLRVITSPLLSDHLPVLLTYRSSP